MPISNRTTHQAHAARGASLVCALALIVGQHEAALAGPSAARSAIVLVPTDGAPGDNFGRSVAVSGSTVVVGAYQHTVHGLRGAGAAYVFTPGTPTWTQEAELLASDAAPNDAFGTAVAVEGTIAIVGAPAARGAAGAGQGAAYVFVQNGTTWTQQAKLVASDAAAHDGFGEAIAVRGGLVIVGAPGKASGGSTFQGAAYVFSASGTTWTQDAKLVASDGVQSDRFGSAVAIDGTTALVGASMKTVGAFSSEGAAYIFGRGGARWLQVARLVPDDSASDYGFGASVALSGTTALVGAADHGTGAAYLFTQTPAYVFLPTTARWPQQAKLVPRDASQADNFGSSVALSGGVSLIGARSKDDMGAAYTFGWSGAAWGYGGRLPFAQREAHDGLGVSAAVSGSVGVVGSNHGPSGTAYVVNLGRAAAP